MPDPHIIKRADKAIYECSMIATILAKDCKENGIVEVDDDGGVHCRCEISLPKLFSVFTNTRYAAYVKLRYLNLAYAEAGKYIDGNIHSMPSIDEVAEFFAKHPGRSHEASVLRIAYLYKGVFLPVLSTALAEEIPFAHTLTCSIETSHHRFLKFLNQSFAVSLRNLTDTTEGYPPTLSSEYTHAF